MTRKERLGKRLEEACCSRYVRCYAGGGRLSLNGIFFHFVNSGRSLLRWYLPVDVTGNVSPKTTTLGDFANDKASRHFWRIATSSRLTPSSNCTYAPTSSP